MLRRTVLLGNFGYWLSCWYYFDTYHSPKYTADAHMETTFPACSGLLQQDCVSFLPPQTAKYDTGVDLSSEFSRFQSDQVWRLWVSKDPVPISHGHVHAHQRSELFWQNKEDVTLGLGDILLIYVSWTTVNSSFFNWQWHLAAFNISVEVPTCA